MIIKNKFDKDKLFFTSDDHFFNGNSIQYFNRPYKDVIDMNNSLIQNWNNTVPEDGIVFQLGDFGFTSNIEHIQELVNTLNGTIYLIYGNHCYTNRWNRPIINDIFEGRIMDVASISVLDNGVDGGKTNFFMSHYPHLYWPKPSYHLHGHVHSGPKTFSQEIVPFNIRRYDVGVDNNNYTPISYNNLMLIFKEYAD